MGLSGSQGATGSLAADTGLGVPAGAPADVTYQPTALPSATALSDDQLRRLLAQLQLANVTAQTVGMLREASRGPGASPLMPLGGGGAGQPFVPTALRHQRLRPRELGL